MKILFLIGLLFQLSANAQIAFQPNVVDSFFHTGYIPDGFDNNDHVQIVAEGTYSNTCYRPANYKVDIDQVNKKINIEAKSYKYEGMCLMVLVPYNQVIDLGLMSSGNYEVTQKSEVSSSLGSLKIRVATNASADDYLYAPISQAFWEKDGIDNMLSIRGEFTNTCWKIKDIQVDVQKENKVIVVLPISEMEEGVACIDKMVPFEKKVKVSNVPNGRYLVHVRSTNAKSVNSLVDIF